MGARIDLSQTVDGLSAVVRKVHRQAHPAQQLAGQQAVEFVVFDHQHSGAVQRLQGIARFAQGRGYGHPWISRRGPMGPGIIERIVHMGSGLHEACCVGTFQSQREPEDTALPALAAHAHGAAHLFGQVPGDGQPQTRATVLPGGGDVGLLEALKELGLLCLGQPDAGVAHFEAQGHVAFGPRLHLHAQVHATALGELHRIAAEVQQHLADAQTVAHQVGRELGIDVQVQRQPLGVCLVDELGMDIAQDLGDVHAQALQLQFARLDLGQVQHVVDDAQQVLAGPLNLLQVTVLDVTLRRGERQMGQTDDGIHRRADFVAHVGQEG